MSTTIHLSTKKAQKKQQRWQRRKRGMLFILVLFIGGISFIHLNKEGFFYHDNEYSNSLTTNNANDYPTISSLDELTPKAKEKCLAFLDACAKEGLPVRVTETYRSQERQNALYAQGRTTSGPIVTWTKKSRHTSRCAFDICKNVKGEEFSDPEFFKKCADIGRKMGLTCGYDWKEGQDPPHYEYHP